MMCIALPVSWGVSLGMTGPFPSLSLLPSPTPIPPNSHPSLNLQPRRGPSPSLSFPPLPEPLSFSVPLPSICTSSLSEVLSLSPSLRPSAPSSFLPPLTEPHPLSEARNSPFVKRS